MQINIYIYGAEFLDVSSFFTEGKRLIIMNTAACKAANEKNVHIYVNLIEG